MNIDRTLRDKLKNMPRIKPKTSPEAFRRQVLAEVEQRERRPRKPRRFILPTVFAAAFAAFMFMILSPWILQKAGNDNFETGESELSTMSGVPSSENSAVHDDEAGDDTSTDAKDGSINKGDEPESDTGEKGADDDRPPEESVTERAEESNEAQVGIAQSLGIESEGQVTREIAVEGMQEQAVFDRYTLQPYGLQMLIPVMPNGEKWFGEPVIDEGASSSVVFGSNSETMENGELLLSSITVTAYDDKSPADVKKEQVVTEEENAKEHGYAVNSREEQLSNGERLLFFRTLQNAVGNRYGYVREVFITEQNGRTYAFHIGRNEVTSEGWEPRLKEVVYPELKVIE